jgi:hypothetical protein
MLTTDVKGAGDASCPAAQAEEILKSIHRDPERPHYREDSFRRKLAAARGRERRLPVTIGCRESGHLVESEWSEVKRLAGLTPVQEEVVAMRLEGHTFEDIGRIRGHTKQGAQNVFFQAAKKLAKAWMEYPYRGLHEVYRSEVRRRGTRP